MKRFKIDWSKSDRDWRRELSNIDEWDRWDRGHRRRLGWRSGLAFWSQTNTPGSRVLLSRHWPHHLCWSWSIWIGKRREGFDGPRHFSLVASRKYRFMRLWLWSAYINVSWQDTDWMAGMGYRDTAPKLYWKHHLEHAEPAGTA